MALVNYLVFICIGTMFSGISSIEEQDVKAGVDYKKAYVNLLNSIIKLNEKRLDAMIVLSDLQQTNVATKLRGGRETSEEAERDDRPVLVVVVDQIPKLRNDITKNNNPPKISIIMPNNIKKEDDDDDDDSDDSSEEGMTIEDKKDVRSKNDWLNSLKISNDDKKMLRKNWRGSCDKKAAKQCRKACVKAYKNVCSSFKCKSRMKRKFKKECKYECKNKFKSGSGSGSSSE